MASVSGKNLGLTAGLINVIVPVLIVVLVVAYIISIFNAIAGLASTSTIPSLGFLGGYLFGFIALGVISFVGIILFLVAMYQLSHYYQEHGIFNNAIIGFLVTIIGGVVTYILSFVYLMSVVGSFTRLGGSYSSSTAMAAFTNFFISLAVVFIVAYVVQIVSAIFYMRAFSKLAEKSEVGSFHTAGLLFLIGTILTILVVGVVLIWIAWIYATSGFHSLKPKQEPNLAYASPPPPPTQTPFAAPVKRCSYCGADNNPNAIYCRNCGKPI